MTHAIRLFTTPLFLFFILFQATLVPAAASAPISSASSAGPKNVPTVRVLVAEDRKSLEVTIKGAYRIWALPSKQLLKKGDSLSLVTLTPISGGIKLGNEECTARGIRFEPLEGGDILLNQSHFRGAVDILKDKAGLLYAINQLKVEDYLYGVLHYEVAPWWPIEALEAQAIAARTYALYQVSVSRGAEFALRSSTSSQVYGGSTTEKFRTKRAVDLTAGEVLMFQGKIFPAFFHATCAGVTAGANELWKVDLPSLAGGVHCGYCRLSPHYYWRAKAPLSEIEERMVKYGHPVGRILKIEVITQTPSGRAGSLRITGTSGDFVMAAKDFRVWIGGDRMRSTLFKIAIRDDMAEFNGTGWGHGVGLCQWGALGQALLGRTHETILKFYYPAAEIISYEAK